MIEYCVWIVVYVCTCTDSHDVESVQQFKAHDAHPGELGKHYPVQKYCCGFTQLLPVQLLESLPKYKETGGQDGGSQIH